MRFINIVYICLWMCLCAGQLLATSISEKSSYPAFCQQASQDEVTFASFKRHPSFSAILEHVSYEMGADYLRIICEDYPHLIPLFDEFRKNDSLGDPITYSYGEYGSFSPTTLRYIKTVGDLQKRFGDLSRLKIVEIGGGYGGLCYALSIAGFKQYTLIDLPPVNALSKKYLEALGVQEVNWIASGELDRAQEYDLVISNYAFSEIDRQEQYNYLNRVILPTPNGYMIMNFISEFFRMKSLSLNEMLRLFFESNKSGKVEIENPLSHPRNVLVTWKEAPADLPLDETPLYPSMNQNPSGNAVSYLLSGGRLGDNLIAYFHAKWIAYKSGTPFIYKPFPGAENLMLSYRDPVEGAHTFDNTVTIFDEGQISLLDSHRTLFVVPYVPECPVDFANLPLELKHQKYIKVDWDDRLFKKELMLCMTPTSEIKTVDLPKNLMTLGVHVRRGGNVDNTKLAQKQWPLKFPPDSYYIAEIKRVAEIFKDREIYVHLFTDDLHPSKIVKKYKKQINNSRLRFGTRTQGNGPSQNIFEDLFSLAACDCLIRSQSNFSMIASKIGNHQLLIYPRNYQLVGDQVVIDQVEMEFRSDSLNRF